MKISNLAFELADLRAEQERQAGIAKARHALRGAGEVNCIDCGEEIEATRRQVMPSAIRCIECQQQHERM